MDQNQTTDNQNNDNQATEDQAAENQAVDNSQATDNQVLDEQPLDSQTDNELQKAIDNITNTTNVDPVFSDPVAAPSSVPEGDTGELGEPVGPFPEPKVEMVAPVPDPIAPVDPVNIPDLNLQVPEPAPMPAPELTPEPVPNLSPEPTIQTSASEPIITTQTSETLSVHQIKEAALHDLIPLLDRLNMNPSQKFSIYRNIFEDLKDYTVLDPAYKAAKEIPNDTERAEALLYLVQSIDRM